jgi:hypothetical protein
MALSRFNPGRPQRPMGKPNPRAAMLCTEWVKARGGVANFDQLYRMLMEQGFQANEAHLAVEDFMRSSMLKKTRPVP